MYCSVLLCDVMAFYLQVLCCVVRCREGARGARDVPDEARGEQSGRHARAQRPPARDRRAQRRAARALGLRLPRAARRHRCARATSIARHATPRHLPSRPFGHRTTCASLRCAPALCCGARSPVAQQSSQRPLILTLSLAASLELRCAAASSPYRTRCRPSDRRPLPSTRLSLRRQCVCSDC